MESGAGANQRVTHASSHPAVSLCVDSSDLEFCCLNFGERAQSRSQFLDESGGSESGLLGEGDVANLESRAGANNSRVERPRRSSQESRREDALDGIGQIGAPLREKHGNSIVILFGDEVVEAGLGLQQRGIESGLGSVVGMEMECGVDQGGLLSGEAPEERKRQASPQEVTPWNFERKAHQERLEPRISYAAESRVYLIKQNVLWHRE